MPGKWSLHLFYMRDPNSRKLLPETQLLNSKSFRALVGRYGSVYVKPNMEHTGKGIMKVWKMGGSYRLVKVRGKQRKFETLNEVTRSVMNEAGGKPHIVQRTIDLAEISQRPYDIRVMMMRDRHDRWLYTGMLAKVAGKTSIVTNVLRGKGFVLPVEEALRRSLTTDKTRQKHILSTIIKTSYTICKRFNHYKYSSQIGIDFALDRSGQLWIIEVNFDYPSHSLFAHLADKRMYKLIKKTHRDYLQRKRQRNA
ncbi:YheC/YheD family protein [Paenibacillus marinisediminis]